MKKSLFFFILLTISVLSLLSQPLYNEAGIRLYHTPSIEEIEWGKKQDLSNSKTDPSPAPQGELRPIAEYEPAEAVLIRYPFGIPISLIKEMSQDITVITIVANQTQQNNVLSQYNSNGVNIANCKFLIANTDSYWTRDYGPWFMAIDNNEVAMYDFNYNRPRPNDNKINEKLADFLSNNATNINRYASNLEHCGGNFMNDGVAQATSTTLILVENQNFTEQEIKTHFQEYMGINQYHIVEDALGDYIAHIDCWGKFLAPNKILIGQVPTTNPQYAIFEQVADYFSSQISSWGMPFEVYRVYTPGTTQSPTPYTNSLILNNKVFVPQTGNPNDQAALQIYQNAMPGYQIIGVPYNSLYGWENTDALHCRTHEIADRCMLYIKHNPYFGEIANTGNLIFNAEVHSYCNNNIYPDSVILYLRVDGGEYTEYYMENIGNNNWTTTVSGLPSKLIEYYIFAADNSERRECHPYIGASDPHKFMLIDAPILSLSKTNSYVTLDSTMSTNDYIIISNIGNVDLYYEIIDIDFYNSLSINPLSGIISPSDSETIELVYNLILTKSTNYTGSFKILTNDSEHLETLISLSAGYNTITINDLNCSTTDIYSNPVRNFLIINYNSNNFSEAVIYNVLGKQLKNVQLSNGLNSIDVQTLANGIYFIKIDAKIYKFIKQD